MFCFFFHSETCLSVEPMNKLVFPEHYRVILPSRSFPVIDYVLSYSWITRCFQAISTIFYGIFFTQNWHYFGCWHSFKLFLLLDMLLNPQLHYTPWFKQISLLSDTCSRFIFNLYFLSRLNLIFFTFYFCSYFKITTE